MGPALLTGAGRRRSGARAVRPVLILALLAACGGETGDDDPRVTGPLTAPIAAAYASDPHAGVTCSGCHAGGRADIGRAAVPRASCTAAGCHEDGGPAEVSIATVTFEHRRHGADGGILPSCAGCHTHDEGTEPLHASVDACALCHADAVSGEGGSGAECRLCHQRPQHVTLTAEGVPVAHSMLPWTTIGCVRCHYDVADPPVAVETTRCASCHRDVRAATAGGIGADLHPAHEGLTCTACHVKGAHRVRAMSSAVSLVCSDCHARAHQLELPGARTIASIGGARLASSDAPVGSRWTDAATCVSCHGDIHNAQQRLLLGVLPQGRTIPSTKFTAGLTCRSCHVPTARVGPTEALRGQAEACAGCHTTEYEQVLDWWLDGAARRQAAVRGYLDGAQRALGGAVPDTVAGLLERAERSVSLVEAAGGQHNLELADRIFRESVDQVRDAYRLAGRAAPAPPALGRPPHYGLCAGCHYAEEPWNYRDMPADFHRDVMRIEEQP